MKTAKYLTAFVASLAVVTLSSAPVLAAHFWKVDISTPKPLINSRSFDVQFTTLSTEADDTFTVELLQNGTAIGTKSTTKAYGDSGTFDVVVPADGTYNYSVKATNSDGGEVKTTATKSVTVDATPTNAPSYGGKSRNGNTYSLTFTAPSNGDVSSIAIYSSPSTSFVADSSTRVGVVNVSPGQTVTFSYTAADSRERYHAVQAFDQAGNGSSLSGDPNISVRSVNTAGGRGATNAGANADGTFALADAQANAAANNDGTVAGNEAEGGQVGSEAASTDSDKNDDASGNSSKWYLWLLALIAVLAAAYYYFFYRTGRYNPFSRNTEN